MRRILAGLVLCCAGESASAAFVLSDRSFFADKPHTFLDFESRGDGTPLGLGFMEVRHMPPDEYAGQGLRFHGPMAWGDLGVLPNTGSGSSDAVDIVGSWPTTVGVTQDVVFELEFLVPVRSFGLGVVQQAFVHFGEPSADFTTTITAFNAGGDVIGVTRLWDETIDGGAGNVYAGGQYGDEWRIWMYGFMGLATDEPIARLRFDNAWQSMIDDLYFSAIPAPGPAAALGLLGFGALARRRRR